MNEYVTESYVVAKSRAFGVVMSASVFMLIAMIVVLFQLAG